MPWRAGYKDRVTVKAAIYMLKLYVRQERNPRIVYDIMKGEGRLVTFHESQLGLRKTNALVGGVEYSVEAFHESHAVDEVESIPRRGTNVVDHEIYEVV